MTLVLRVVAVAALVATAVVHWRLAHLYDSLGDPVSQGDLFRVQAGVAVAVAAWLLVTGNRWAWRLAGLVGASSLGALLLYRYVDVGAIGPIPNMHDASWLPSPDKALSAVFDAVVVVAWLVWELVTRRRGAHGRRPAGS